MSGVTTITQSGDLANLVRLETWGNYLIEGPGVTVTTGNLACLPCDANFTVADGATLQLGATAPGLLDTFTIGDDGTLVLGSNLNVSCGISFGSGATGGDLVLAPGVQPWFLSSVHGFTGGDEIDFQGAGAPKSSTSFTDFNQFAVTDFCVTLANGHVEQFALAGNIPAGNISLSPDNAGGFIVTDTACFAAGTLILTTSGEVPVENLRAGDLAVLADGSTAEIKFIGRRHLDLSRHPRPAAVRPVRIAAGALADGVPARALVLSPDHALFIDSLLVQAKDLIDGAAVVQDETIPAVDYYHIELPSHGILLAQGTPAESYLETGNRGMFENADEPLILHPDLMQIRREAESVAPLCTGGPALHAIRARLHARKLQAGLAVAETATIAARAAGQRLAPLMQTATHATFAVPAGAGAIDLIFPVFSPASFDTSSSDRRHLGIALAGILIDGQPTRLESLSPTGLHPRSPGDPHVWTTGRLRLSLPDGVQNVTLQIAALPKRWRKAA